MTSESAKKVPKVRSAGRVLYEVSVSYTGSLNTVRQREPVVTFFSNLRKAVDAVVGELAINNWPVKVNYTAVYRGIRERGFYACDYDLRGLRVFRIRIVPRVLNPVLPRLGIDENPAL
ncbi:hypothetical protein [Spirosoma rhododendri]|uniref:Uncharacterized protein n=1 Tax=Spirosoma rhododendri TaxID=2728024 RepID=A0A7L5DP86_9BACT|nr:hypothetical protein [Spirosoma rhododendri]QJD77827.1 hypothetical protein HH216_04860 [Spirosoma rhododendri]